MLKKLILIATLAVATTSFASDDAPEFDYGYGESKFKWGVEVPIMEQNTDLKLRVGTRLQALMENKQSKDNAGNDSLNQQDFYIRRARLQVEAKFKKNLSAYMDIRADKVDQGNGGGNGFALGDAYFQVKNFLGSDNLKLKLFRAKYDISRSQTVSSSRLLIPNRSSISDFAADYISKGRRGNNIQLLGNWSNKVKAQVVVGDGVVDGSFDDALGNGAVDINSQNLAHGVRVRVSPIPGWEEKKLKETQFGHGQHFTVGAGAFFLHNINFDNAAPTPQEVDRKLYNFDLSFHIGPISLMSEYFIFEGMVEDHTAPVLRTGKSEGFVVQGEYVLTNFHYISPFVRYENWDRFTDNSDFDQTSYALGVNYYLKGNKLRVGGYYEKTESGNNLAASTGDKESELISLNLMMHY